MRERQQPNPLLGCRRLPWRHRAGSRRADRRAGAAAQPRAGVRPHGTRGPLRVPGLDERGRVWLTRDRGHSSGNSPQAAHRAHPERRSLLLARRCTGTCTPALPRCFPSRHVHVHAHRACASCMCIVHVHRACASCMCIVCMCIVHVHRVCASCMCIVCMRTVRVQRACASCMCIVCVWLSLLLCRGVERESHHHPVCKCSMHMQYAHADPSGRLAARRRRRTGAAARLASGAGDRVRRNCAAATDGGGRTCTVGYTAHVRLHACAACVQRAHGVLTCTCSGVRLHRAHVSCASVRMQSTRPACAGGRHYGYGHSLRREALSLRQVRMRHAPCTVPVPRT